MLPDSARSASSPAPLRWALGLGLVALLVVGFALLSLWPHRPATPRATTGASSSVCTQPAVVTAESLVPIYDPVAAAARVTIPPGEPAIVARVNGEAITAVDLEQGVQLALKNHQQQLAQLPPGAPPLPPPVMAELEQTPSQVRQQILAKRIENLLWLQEAHRLGVVVSTDTARAEALRVLHVFQATPASDPTHITFEALLCANHLDESTFPTAPVVVHGYQDALTIGAVEQHVQAGLPPATQQDHAAVAAAIRAYVLRLRQTGRVEIYI